jgi:cytochrome P450
VLNEVLRMRPAVGSLDRVVTRDTELCGRRFVKGTVLSAFLWAPVRNACRVLLRV